MTGQIPLWPEEIKHRMRALGLRRCVLLFCEKRFFPPDLRAAFKSIFGCPLRMFLTPNLEFQNEAPQDSLDLDIA